MTLGRAIAIVKSINSPCPTADVQEKLEAIKAIMEAATLNSVAKPDLLRIIRWMWALDVGKLLEEASEEAARILAPETSRESWTAEWVKSDGYTECSKCGYWYDSPENEDEGDRPAFCPSCGRSMTPTAWVELEKRLRGGK